MLACGLKNRYGLDHKATLEQKAERFTCMKRAGYPRSDGFDLCALDARCHSLLQKASSRASIPACRAIAIMRSTSSD